VAWSREPAQTLLTDFDCHSKLLSLYLFDSLSRDGEVLAETSNSDKYQKPHPSVWITKHPKARVVGIALGHDARVHDLKPYQQLLINAAKWTSGK
jgi:type 1 glutamine amidotransferase